MSGTSYNPSVKSYHSPVCGSDQNVCDKCGLTVSKHIVNHVYLGEQCQAISCILGEAQHKKKSKKSRIPTTVPQMVYVGLDGEGQDGEDERCDHNYVLLSSNTEDNGNKRYVELLPGHKTLTTGQCLDFILSHAHPRRKIFTFSFNYDLTKMLTDLDNKALYLLFRPNLRQRVGRFAALGPWPVKYATKDKCYRLNLQGTKFTVSEGPHTEKKGNGKWEACERCSTMKKRTVVVWDLFKFYQARFVQALTDWKVGDAEMLARMDRMKAKRADFNKEDPAAVKAYCLEECRYIAELAHKLIDAHAACGIKLRSFYGAGSTGGAMLKLMGIKERLRPPPDEMMQAVACGFFGGRFENSVIGVIKGQHLMVQGQRDGYERWYNSPIYDLDISSAYPYQLTRLPCLLHGKWQLFKGNKGRRMLEKSRSALVRYSLEYNSTVSDGPWGPFPFRTEDGSISFPACSGGGWLWKDEFLSGEKYWPNVVFHEAWIYECDCECQPFAKIPYYYSQRVKIGKEGAGIILKLGPNSAYGKLAQSVGNALFQSWIYAGLITSGCRSQINEVYGLHEDPTNLLIIATDGVKTRENIITPLPEDTGTWELLNENGEIVRKPLGGWEKKIAEKGFFVARPGIYFPLDPTDKEIKEVRGRGVGKGVVLENHERILASWQKYGLSKDADVANVSRFCGAKTSISYKPSTREYNRADGKPGQCRIEGPNENPKASFPRQCRHGGLCENSAPAYGQWVARTVSMGFDPLPKRASVNEDGVTLRLREFPQDLSSMPYKNAVKSKEALEMQAAMQELIEQPDADLSDMEDFE